MFGTLVVQLPVEVGHTGGQLEIKGPLRGKYVWETAKVRKKVGVAAVANPDLQQAMHQ
jgi:hypothetical protein